MQVSELSVAKLLAAIAKQAAIVREHNDAFIAAGRGHERFSEIRESAKNGHDLLALSYVAALDAESALEYERARRLRYHGTLKPIKA